MGAEEGGSGDEQSGGGDAGVTEPVVEGVEGEGDGVTKIEGLDGAVEEVGDGPGGGGGGGGWTAAGEEEEEERPKLGVDGEKGIKKVREKGEREERLRLLSGVFWGVGGEEGEEAVGDVGEEEVELVELLFLALLHGGDLVAAEVDEGACAEGHGDGGAALVLHGSSYWLDFGKF